MKKQHIRAFGNDAERKSVRRKDKKQDKELHRLLKGMKSPFAEDYE